MDCFLWNCQKERSHFLLLRKMVIYRIKYLEEFCISLSANRFLQINVFPNFREENKLKNTKVELTFFRLLQIWGLAFKISRIFRSKHRWNKNMARWFVGRHILCAHYSPDIDIQTKTATRWPVVDLHGYKQHKHGYILLLQFSPLSLTLLFCYRVFI